MKRIGEIRNTDTDSFDTSNNRCAAIARTTNETDIQVSIDLDGSGKADIDTGIPFFDHMLNAFTRHGMFDIRIKAEGDIEVDAHHTVEDVGIVLGQTIDEALGDRRGITRFSSNATVMDEALILSAMDISGRGQLHWEVDIPVDAIATFDTQLAKEFFIAFATNSGITLHMQKLAGENAHHLIEACFKGCGRALREAVSIDPRAANAIPSTKGTI